jgi:branched-chain amino acid aminotransferase
MGIEYLFLKGKFQCLQLKNGMVCLAPFKNAWKNWARIVVKHCEEIAMTKGKTKKVSKPAAKVAVKPKKATPISEKLTKMQIIRMLAEDSELSVKQVKTLFVALQQLMHRSVTKNGCGEFVLPEVAIKVRRVKKKASKKRMGRNPFTGQEIVIPAKPAREAIKVVAPRDQYIDRSNWLATHLHSLTNLREGIRNMQTTPFIWQSGRLVAWEDAKTHVLSHTLHYGGGAFEGIRFYQTSKGSALFRLQEHIARLLYSVGVLQMALPFNQEAITDAVLDVVRANGLTEGYVRPLAFYGYGKMGVNPTGSQPELIIACWPWGAYLPVEAIDVKVSDYIRIHPRSTDVSAKLCGHYVNGILASLAIKGTHYHEALFLDSEGRVSEGVGENLFVIKGGVIYTPKLGTILPGITRETAIGLARDLGYTVIEKDMLLPEVLAADEAFFTGTAAEVTAIRSLNDSVFGTGGVGKVTAHIKENYHQIVRGQHEDPRYQSYLTFV